MFSIKSRLVGLLCLVAMSVAGLSSASVASAATTVAGKVVQGGTSTGAPGAYTHWYKAPQQTDAWRYVGWVRADSNGFFNVSLPNDGYKYRAWASWEHGSCAGGTRRRWTGWDQWPKPVIGNGTYYFNSVIRVYRTAYNPC
jgi:hypothetical protein